MRRARAVLIVMGAVAIAAACLPATAIAGTYSWAQPTDFTSTSPGANPEHKYGAPSWSYHSSAGALSFSSGGWSDASGGTIKPNGGNLDLLPAMGNSVTLRWTSPFTQTQSVAVSATVTRPGSGSCSVGWTLTGGSSGSGNATIGPTTMSVAAGDTIDFTVTDSTILPINHSAACDTVEIALTISATVTAPAVTLTTPSGGTINGQPTFAGSASTRFGDAGSVTVKVYSGSSASGSPVQSPTATVTSGSYSTGPISPLPDGTYTARAEQTDLAGDTGQSSATTFTVKNPAPHVTLNSLGSAPLQSATPTLSGTADTGSGDSQTVNVGIWSGGSVSGQPVRALSTSRNGSAFSVTVSPDLPDGLYTAVAGQTGPGQPGFSSPVTFRIKVNPPALTLDLPASGAKASNRTLLFSGNAGNVLGDSSQVTLQLFRGKGAQGFPLGTLQVTRSGGSWSARWPTKLDLGSYTVRAIQSDDAGHITVTATHNFLIVRPPKIIGAVRVSRSGHVTLPITCVAPPGQSCTGNVLVVTVKRFQPVPGGPAGNLRLAFAFVSIPAGRTIVVSATVKPRVVRILRHARRVDVRVTMPFALALRRVKLTRR